MKLQADPEGRDRPPDALGRRASPEAVVVSCDCTRGTAGALLSCRMCLGKGSYEAVIYPTQFLAEG
jgi:hypothetical protein